MGKKTIKILALDTSSRVTGWALFINGKYIESNIIDLRKMKNTEERISKMCFSIGDVIDKCKPTKLVIEEMPSTRNGKTTRILARIIGAVYYHCLLKDIPYEEFKVSSWRSIIGINARNKKIAKQNSIERAVKYKDSINDDEADAINICDAYCIRENIGTKGE